MTPADGHKTRGLVDHVVERQLAAAVIRDPRHLDTLRIAVADIVDYHAKAALAAAVNVFCRGGEVTEQLIRDRLQTEHADRGPHRAGEDRRDLRWFDEMIATQLPGDPPIDGWTDELLALKSRRDAALQARADDEIPHPAEADLPARPRWRRCSDLVDEILERASEQWISLRLGTDELAQVRPGGIAVLMGPTGSGKSSLACGLASAHARDAGPVVVLSRELPADEFAARMLGAQLDASWPEMLRGGRSRAEMARVASSRVVILDRRDATLPQLGEAIEAMQDEYPGEPVMVAIDYVQILPSGESDMRARVSEVIEQIDDISRRYRVVTILISQMSRASSRAARNGEALGADSTDGGAESAAIERAASLTLSIGACGQPREDGSCQAEISLGKARMLGGDRVLPAIYWGRSGRWRLDGEARPAADVKAERAGQRDTAKQHAAELAIAAAARQAAEPQPREDLSAVAACGVAIRRAAMSALLARGELVEVSRKNPRSRAWKVWAPELAKAAGIPIVQSGEAP